MTSEFHVVLTDYARQRVAVVPNGAGLTLPKFQRGDGVRYNTVMTVNEAVDSKWNASVTTARCIREGSNGTPDVFALHNHSKDWTLPPGARWVDIDKLKDTKFEQSYERECIEKWLASEKDSTWHRIPWSSPDWLGKATKWIEQVVHDMGGTMSGAPTQVRAWAISCVLEVKTTKGTFYLKALPDHLSYSPQLEQYLSRQFPQYTADVVAIEPTEHWFVTREFNGSPPGTYDEWHIALNALAQIQQHCNDKFDSLLSFGCHDRRLSKLPSLMHPVVQEVNCPEMGDFYGITEAEAEKLGNKIERNVPQLCEQLASYGITETLIHGDWWGSNIIVKDKISGKSPMLFDWTDSALTHPFFDIYMLLTSEKNDKLRADEQKAHLDICKKTYPNVDLQAAYEVSQKLAAYYYLLHWRNIEINAPLQSRWELIYLVQRFARNILTAPQ